MINSPLLLPKINFLSESRICGQVLRMDYIVYTSCPSLTATLFTWHLLVWSPLRCSFYTYSIYGRSASSRVGPRNEFADVPHSPRRAARAISQHIPSEFCEGPVVRDGLTTRPLVNRILSGGDVPGLRSRDRLVYSHLHRLQSSFLYTYFKIRLFPTKKKDNRI